MNQEGSIRQEKLHYLNLTIKWFNGTVKLRSDKPGEEITSDSEIPKEKYSCNVWEFSCDSGESLTWHTKATPLIYQLQLRLHSKTQLSPGLHDTETQSMLNLVTLNRRQTMVTKCTSVINVTKNVT